MWVLFWNQLKIINITGTTWTLPAISVEWFRSRIAGVILDGGEGLNRELLWKPAKPG